jgi:phytoene dehydrogenase-like protein
MGTDRGRSVLVVGGGVAGLAAGSYLGMNGYRPLVLEQGLAPGGVARSWHRKGYTFDGATEWLPGSAPPLGLNDILAEVLDFGRLEIVDFEEFTRIRVGGRELRVLTDARGLRDEMLRIAPRDGRVIDLPVRKAPELMGLPDLARDAADLLPLHAFARRWRGITIGEYASRFSDPDLGRMFRLIFPRHEFFSVMGLVFALGWMSRRCAGHPVGGSARLVGLLEDRMRALGGGVRTGARVAGILVSRGRARGVRLEDGEEIAADAVICTVDYRQAIGRLLGARHVSRMASRMLGRPSLYPGMLQVSLGIARTFEGQAHKSLVELAAPLAIGRDGDIRHAIVKLSSLDPGSAPPGATAVVAHVRTTDPGHLIELRRTDRDAYRAEKARVAEAVIDTLESWIGGVRERVEVVDVATPATYARYTGVWNGSYQGWAPTPALVGRSLERTVPGLDGFYMAGQWIEPGGGIPRAVLSARNAVQLLCRDDGRRFVTTLAG